MDTKTIALIALIVTIVLFVPFYPFRLIKRVILFFFNRFVPLPIKFDDIGGIPIIGMRLFNVRVKLGAGGSLEAEEMQFKFRFLRMLMLRRPHFNPMNIYRPKIRVAQVEQKGEVWFLFPLTAMRQVLSTFFANLTGLNVIRIYGGVIVIEGKRGETVIEDFNGEFTSHGMTTKVKRLSCSVGPGDIEIQYPERGPMVEGRILVHNLHLQDLAALKVPRDMSGPVNIEAVMRGTVNNMEIVGYMDSPSLFMRTEPIVDFRSPLTFKGKELTLEKMQGRVGEYTLTGRLVTDVETDISDLVLKGGGSGEASGSILRMLNMNPFISYSRLDADVHLWGDLEEFYDFEGDIRLRLEDSVVDFSQIGEGTMADFPLRPIPEADLHMTLKKGVLTFEQCELRSGTVKINVNGKIDMHLDEIEYRVDRSQFDLDFKASCGDLKDLAAQFGLKSMNVEGTADGEFSMYADYSTFFHELRGDGRLGVKDARVRSLPVGRFGSLDGIVDLQFNRVDTEVYLEKEGIGFRNLECVADWLDVTGKGFVGFFTKEIKIDGDMGTVPGTVMRRSVLKYFPAAERLARRMRLGFSLTGKTGRPRFRLHIGNTIRDLLLPGGAPGDSTGAAGMIDDGHPPETS